MNAFFWWVLLLLLILLISALTLYFLYDLFGEFFQRLLDQHVSPPQTTLNRYQFDKSDVEDLTNIQGHFQTIIPKLHFVNEVDSPAVKHIATPSRKYSLLPDIHESIPLTGSCYSIQDIMGDVKEERNIRRNSERRASVRSVVTEGMRKKSLASISTGFTMSVDSVDCLDPTHIEILRTIADIEEEARRLENDIDSFSGDRNSLRFFEINEKLIRCNIALSEILTPMEKQRERKKEVMHYITQLQTRLKSKV